MKQTDQRTLAFINLFAIFGALPALCEMSNEAKAAIAGKRVSMGISVKDGPCGTLHFDNGTITVTKGCDKCDIKLPFSSPEKFNGMIDGTVTPIPSKGFTKIGFLLKNFIPLTDILSRYLRPSEDDLKDEQFYRTSTLLMFHVITGAVSQIGNEDKVGRASASYIVDGHVRMAITEGDQVLAAAHIVAKNHRLTTIHTDTDTPMSQMEFDGVHNARGLFDGAASSFTLICDGKLRLGGMISQLDNVNRILDRVGLYLA
jgi:hypothetical protein